MTYTVKYKNAAVGATNGETGVQLSDTLPSSSTYVPNSCTATCSYDSLTNTLTWNLGSIAASSAEVTKTYQVTVDPAAANNSVLTNKAQILSAENDANIANNTASVTTTVFTPSIAGTVVDDSSGNGAVDAGETGLAGAVIQLYKDGGNNIFDASDVQVGASVTTDSSGEWAFTSGLVKGTKYFVVRTNPSGYASTNAVPETVATAIDQSTATKDTNDRLAVVLANVTGSIYSSNNFFLAQIAQRTTTTTLARTAGTTPSVYGDAIAYTATVTSASGNPSSSGTVTFKDGTTVLCLNVPLAGNAATCTVSKLSVVGSPHSLTAEYSGTTTVPLYSSSTSGPLSQAVTAKPITGTFTSANKVYDGNTDAVAANRSLTGTVVGDVVSLTGGTASFGTKDVGTAKTVTLTGASLTGADAGNYNLTSVATATADITAAELVGHFSAGNKIYDGNTTATIIGSSVTGAAAGDVVSLTGGTATFGTKDVGTNKTVTGTGFTLSGAQAGNYSLASSTLTTTADITKRDVTGSFTSADKVYDGTTDAVATNRSLLGTVAGDLVSLTGGTAAFGTKDVGTNKTVTLTGASLTGADAGNYNLTSVATATADITAAELVGHFSAGNKIYDGNTTATIIGRSVTGAAAGDVVSLTGGTATFGTKDVGTSKTVTGTGFTLSGAQAGNYSLASSTLTTTADITKRDVTGSFTAANKVYDGNTSATATGRSLAGTVTGDAVSLSGGTATFGTRDVGANKTVTLAGASLAGADASNYNLTSVATATADITAKNVTGSFTAGNKVYDGNTTATVTGRSLTGVVAGDVVSLTGGTATFGTKDVGTNKTVTGTGFTLSGAQAGNYALASSTLTTTADITAKALTGSFTAADKVYDGNVSETVSGRSL